MSLAELRAHYHKLLFQDIIRAPKGYPNFSDGTNKASRAIAWGIVNRIGFPLSEDPVKEQTAGDCFEKHTKNFLQSAFDLLQHIRPGEWYYSTLQTSIANFEQYEHLAYLESIVDQDKNLASILGGDYIIHPDIVIGRHSLTDDTINSNEIILSPGDPLASLTPLRQRNRQNPRLILHASISCKWTIRSDRSQNTRTEALNLIRNRKGHLPHIIAVTAEPLPTRIASLALGTGDLDCVYHFALPELRDSIVEINNEDQLDLLISMIEGRRIRDISDLPFDLAV
jgi:hypothetical protein